MWFWCFTRLPACLPLCHFLPAAAFVKKNASLLADLPPPMVALQYYCNEDLYLFDEWVVGAGGRRGWGSGTGVRVGSRPASRRPGSSPASSDTIRRRWRACVCTCALAMGNPCCVQRNVRVRQYSTRVPARPCPPCAPRPGSRPTRPPRGGPRATTCTTCSATSGTTSWVREFGVSVAWE